MTEQPNPPYTRKVLVRLPRRYDVEVHVSKITTEEDEYADIREFIPSLQQYGRGIILPKEMALQAANALVAAVDPGPEEEGTDDNAVD